MSTNAAPVTTAAPAKVSWLKRVGQVMGKVLTIVAKDAKPTADIAAKVASALFPQFSTEIAAGDSLLDNIAAEAVTVEGVASAAGQANGTGTAKLQAVLTNIGPAIDQWVQSKFPGATAVSAASKAGLVTAVVQIMNEIQSPAAAPAVAATTPKAS